VAKRGQGVASLDVTPPGLLRYGLGTALRKRVNHFLIGEAAVHFRAPPDVRANQNEWLGAGPYPARLRAIQELCSLRGPGRKEIQKRIP
jgi:hypothetical protein